MSTSAERVNSVCPHDCPSTCALSIERLDPATIGKVYGRSDQPYTAGVICAKVARYAERAHHPQRLSTPLKRVGAKGVGRAAFVPISWDEALDTVATQLQQISAQYGSEAVWPYFYAGTMGYVQRDGIERLRHVLRYSRQHSTFCIALSDPGWMAGVGVKRGVDGRELSEADLIVIWGANPVHTQVNVMHHLAKARRQRKARTVVIDPYRTPTAEKADLHLMPRPGTDGALACAVMQVLFAEGYADWTYLERYSDDPHGLAQHLSSRTPEWAEAICGVPASRIRAFARLYGKTKRSFLRIGYGFSRSRNGAVNLHAVSCLPMITGAWQYPGGGALYSNGGLYHLNTRIIRGLDALDPSVRVLDQSRIGPILCGNAADLQGGPPVKALFIQNTNPVVVAPESQQVREGFLREDLFVCVHEQFMTETAAMADIVLPATTFLEHDDLYTAGAHTHLQIGRVVLQPHAECRSNHWVLNQLAQRLGAQHPGFAMSEWELIEATLRDSGHPPAEQWAEQGYLDCALPFAQAHFLDGFGHADQRFHFRPDWAALGPNSAGLPEWPDHVALIDMPTPDKPLRLVAAPARQFLNSSFSETLSAQHLEGRPTVKLHPSTAASLQVQEGDLVRLGNQRGSVVVHAQLFDGLQPEVVIVEGLWPNSAFVEGRGINTLTSADPGQPNGGAVFHDTAVWLTREPIEAA